MALDAAATFELRWLIAKSRRRHEMYLETIADAILLASQQVQDKRIDLLERGPELSVAGLFIDFLISVSFSVGPPLIKDGLTNIISSMVAQRLKSFLARPGKVIEIISLKQLTPERIARARIRVEKYEVPTGDPKSAPVEWRLFRELTKETIGIGLEKTKEAIRKGPTKTAPLNDAGGDTPGVALMDSVLSFVRQEHSAIDFSHDLDDFWVASGLLSDANARSLTDFYSKEEQTFRNPTGGSDFRDLSGLKEELKLFFEACIWATVFSARLWKDWRFTETSLRYGETATHAHEHPPDADERLQKYWLARFDRLLQSAKPEPAPSFGQVFVHPLPDPRVRKLRDFFQNIDSMLKTREDVVRLIAPPVAKVTNRH